MLTSKIKGYIKEMSLKKSCTEFQIPPVEGKIFVERRNAAEGRQVLDVRLIGSDCSGSGSREFRGASPQYWH